MPSLLPFTPLDQNREWLGGRFPFPDTFRDGRGVIQPDVIIWMEMPRGVLLGVTLVDPRKPVSFAETLEDALRSPKEGSPRRPARIRVPDERTAGELRGAAGGIPIVVAAVPELDAVFTELIEKMDNDEEGKKATQPTYLGGGDIPATVVKDFFSAAALLFRATPWRHVAEYQVLRVDIPRFDIENACLSVIGAGRESLGILLFRSIHDFLTFGSTAVSPSVTGGIVMRSLSFDRKKGMPLSLIREIEQHRWPIAGAKAYPALICIDKEMSPIEPEEEDYRIMTACAHVFAAFFASHRRIFAVDAPEQVCEVFSADDVTVTITAPYDPDEIAEADRALGDDDALDDDLLEMQPPPGKNDPCPCGSGKKYKKCHFESDEGLR
ncbi:MAG TPA: SEC-C domain-containing protein [Thermoanaerobaculia bacterium]|jgi:hypothetical protein|nr:SEC-C domain-containing protein [Thermoanaerobaculia bacterium]